MSWPPVNRAAMRLSDDPTGLLGDMIRYGTLAAVDNEARTATVQCGDITSPPVRWLSFAGLFGVHIPAAAGEQVVLLCPEGDIGAGLILRGMECDAFPAPASGNLFRIRFPDGSTLDYDPDGHVMTLGLTGGKLIITAPADIDITANVNLTGDLTVTGKIDATGDITAGDISLQTHKHGNVAAGLAKTGGPE